MYDHLIPVNDLHEHTLSMRCTCEPYIEEGLIVHNSWDGREFYEWNAEDLKGVFTREAFE